MASSIVDKDGNVVKVDKDGNPIWFGDWGIGPSEKEIYKMKKEIEEKDRKAELKMAAQAGLKAANA